jgi:hypothetical protein
MLLGPPGESPVNIGLDGRQGPQGLAEAFEIAFTRGSLECSLSSWPLAHGERVSTLETLAMNRPGSLLSLPRANSC